MVEGSTSDDSIILPEDSELSDGDLKEITQLLLSKFGHDEENVLFGESTLKIEVTMTTGEENKKSLAVEVLESDDKPKVYNQHKEYLGANFDDTNKLEITREVMTALMSKIAEVNQESKEEEAGALAVWVWILIASGALVLGVISGVLLAPKGDVC